MIKYVILDFGKVLAYPTTGDWFITPLFLKLIDMSKINRKKIIEVMNSYSDILSRKLITLEEEYDMYIDFYSNVFNDINYNVSEKIIKEIAYDITYNDDKYRFYKGIDEELEKLSKKYTLILLSDNWPCAFNIMKKRGIDKYFDKLYISSIYKEVKKDGVFFDRVINDYNIKKGEAIFVDDNEDLLDVAVTKGLEVRLMDREKEIKKSKYKIINNLVGDLNIDDRMDKSQLIELLNTLKIDKREFWVLSSGALVLRDIYERAKDLDIAVTFKGLEQLNKNYTLTKKENGWYIVNDKVECICDGEIDKLKYKPEELKCGYFVQNIFEYFEYLNSSTRKKDIERIPLVKKYINKIKQS